MAENNPASVTEDDRSSTATLWRPQPRQAEFIACPIFDVFYGGARGGGKTDAVLGDWLAHAQLYERNAIGLMVRRSLVQLVETIERSRVIYTPLGATYNVQDKMWTMPNGARLRFAYLERDSDADGYQGHSYTRVYVEEIGTFPSEKPVMKLMATLRSGAGVPVGFRATGNPGGPGHQWVKRRYIDPAPAGRQIIVDQDTKLKRIYLPSRIADNHFLGEQYVQQLKASGSAQLVRAWLEGDWNVVEGAFFEWPHDCVIMPFVIPNEWTRFRSMDWGYATPFAIYWFAIVPDDFEHDGRTIQRGTLIAYREWYGSTTPNVGVRLTADDVAHGILTRQFGEKCSYGVIDPSAYAESGGPSIAERLARAGVFFDRADNKRVGTLGHLGGWDQMRQRLKAGKLLFFDTCAHAIRTIPALQHDPDRPEDLDTEQEDHAADAVRYACMTRPYVRPREAPPPKPEAMRGVESITVDELIELSQPKRRRRI